jgi:hypothetical protein
VLTKQGKNMSYTTAAKMLKKVADNITKTTLERPIAQESIFKSCSPTGMVKIPIGYCVTGPLKVKGLVWTVNSRTINEEGVESLIKMNILCRRVLGVCARDAGSGRGKLSKPV